MATLTCKRCKGMGVVPLAPTMQAILEVASEDTYKSLSDIRLELRERGLTLSAARVASMLLRLTMWGFLARIVGRDMTSHDGYQYKRVGGS